MDNVNKDLAAWFADEPPGLRNDPVRWLQKKACAKAATLRRDFKTRAEWEAFRAQMRADLPAVIGLPQFPDLKESALRGRVRLGDDLACERVDVYVDDDYAIPAFVFQPAEPPGAPMPGVVLSPGAGQDKFLRPHQEMCVRMAKHGFAALLFDHAATGEATGRKPWSQGGINIVQSTGELVGTSQLALRAAEDMRCGEYLRSRPDVDASRVALTGLCQGGMDTWLAGALDERFCAVAPICAGSTFAAVAGEMHSYQVWSDPSPYPFGILNICDVEHLYAAIAPRPLIARANLPDNWWPVSGLDDIESFTRRIYRLYDAEDRVDFRAEVHEHAITGPFADALEAFLLKYV